MLLVALSCGCSTPPREGFVNVQVAAYSGPPDEELAETVKKAIISKFSGSVRDLDISAANGILTAAGTVDSTDRVREIVQKVAFIDHVREFRYKGLAIDAGDYDDHELTGIVMARLMISPGRAVVANVVVDLLEQFVRVSGTIDSIKHRNQMEKTIRETPGVEGYFITTRVVPPITIGDEMTTLNVITELERFGSNGRFLADLKWRLLGVPTGQIRVRTTNGVVVLSGQVPKLIHKLAVEEAAKDAEGPREIKNLIKVQP